MSEIASYSDVSTLSASYTENGTQIVTSSTNTDKDLFLKLLVAQMTNQDPFNTQDPTQYITQLAQFNTLEQLMNLNDNMEYLVGMTNGVLVNSAMSGATALIGKNVEVYAPEDEAGDDYGKMTYNGKVEGVHIKDGVVYMNVRIEDTGELKEIEYGALKGVNVEESNENVENGNENTDIDNVNKGE